MTHDPAAFRPEDVHAVYGERPRCFLTLIWQFVDGHHVLGRGYVFGAGTKNPRRVIFSSIFNFAPIQRDIHHGPHRDSVELRRLFLRLAREHVMEAVQDGRYELKPIDEEFLAFAETWLQKNLC